MIRVNITPVYSARYSNETLFNHKITPLSKSPLSLFLLRKSWLRTCSRPIFHHNSLRRCCDCCSFCSVAKRLATWKIRHGSVSFRLWLGFGIWIKVRARVTSQRCEAILLANVYFAAWLISISEEFSGKTVNEYSNLI